jgi:hypothetical protein
MNEVSLCDRYFSYILFFPIAFGVVSPCFALDLEAGLWNHIPLGSSFVGSAPSSLNRPHTAGSGHGRSKINSCLNRCLKNWNFELAYNHQLPRSLTTAL